MELYDPPVVVTAQHDDGPHHPVNDYPRDRPLTS
jgi:hypothetical protein